MNKCCEKWLNKTVTVGDEVIHYRGEPNIRINFCPECGSKSKLESEWCECKEGLTTETALGLSQKQIKLLLDKKCFRCEKPIKPKRELPEKMELCVCSNPEVELYEVWQKEKGIIRIEFPNGKNTCSFCLKNIGPTK